MDNPEPPCVECITLPMCMNLLGNIIQDEDAVARMFAMTDLMTKCSIFKDYLHEIGKDNKDDSIKDMDTTNSM